MTMNDLKKQLETWASWSIRNTDGIGWPKETVTGRFYKQKEAASIRGTANVSQTEYIEIPYEVEMIEKAVTRLRKELQDVLRSNYMIWGSYESRAKKMNMGVTLYKKRLYAAHEILLHYTV